MRAKKLPMRCEICRTDARAREAWGCERDTAEPVFELACPRCKGRPGADDCPRCGGRGHVAYRRCPNVILADAPWIEPFFRCLDLLEVGILPAPGGALQQSARFWRMVRVALEARADAKDD